VVDEKGKIMAAQTVLGIHEVCDSIAEKAVSKISYEPARYNGEPIKLRMSNSIEFR
jgi:hydrogenase maturation factor HypF (carbamoyltransferase family)